MSVYAKVWAYDQHPLQVDAEGNPKPDTRNPAAKAVLVALAEFPGVGQRECWPSQETLALMTDFEERTVRRHLAALEAQGFIRRTERRKQGQRLTDMVTLLGPVEAFGPSSKPPDTRSGRDAKATGQSDQSHRTECPGNRQEEPSNPTGGKETLKPVAAENRTQSQLLTDDFYRRLLDKHRVRLEKEQYAFHLGSFKNMLEKDEPTEEEIDRVLSHMVEVYPNAPKIRATKALQDVRLKRDTGEAWSGPAPWEKAGAQEKSYYEKLYPKKELAKPQLSAEEQRQLEEDRRLEAEVIRSVVGAELQ